MIAYHMTSSESKAFHNAMCDLRMVQDMMRDMFRADSLHNKRLENAMKLLEPIHQSLLIEDTVDFDAKMDYFRAYQEEHDFVGIWSMYDLPVNCFLQEHPFPSDAFVVYGKGHVPVMGSTWGDVYRAADCAMRNSGDTHHVFIEGFNVKGNELHMYTGS